jgi:hypothetical protein
VVNPRQGLLIWAVLPAFGCFDPTHVDTDDVASTGSSGGSSTVTATSGPATMTSPQDESDGEEDDDPSVDASPADDSSDGGDTSSASDATGTSSSTGGSSSGDSSTGSAPACPNGVLDDGEDCDDDNDVDDDGCTACAIDPSASCGGEPSVCGPSCDPLLQDCVDGQGCYAIEDSFLCAADVSGGGGAAGDSCDTFDACDPGQGCIAVEDLPACLGAACCTPFCDLSDPSPTCPDGLQCIEWFALGATPPGFEDTGICIAAA